MDPDPDDPEGGLLGCRLDRIGDLFKHFVRRCWTSFQIGRNQPPGRPHLDLTALT